MQDAIAEWARLDGGGTDPARTLKSDVLAEREAVSRDAKLRWAHAGGHDVLSLQHDGVVIALRPGLTAADAVRELCQACSAALGYDQPVETKEMEVPGDTRPAPTVRVACGRVWEGGGFGRLGGSPVPHTSSTHHTSTHIRRC